jgi:hypothetical protein
MEEKKEQISMLLSRLKTLHCGGWCRLPGQAIISTHPIWLARH